MSASPLLEVRGLSVVFDTDEGPLCAVDAIDLAIMPGEVVGLVGESGCGKSATALSLLRLLPKPAGRIESGSIRFRGEEILTLPPERLRALRGAAISMIFQEPMNALSPLLTIERHLCETLQLHRSITHAQARAEAGVWLKKVGIPDPGERLRQYPFQLSGGMLQRVMIAMALMLHPDLVIADEPTTALDVTIQAQILELMLERKDRRTALLLITHDMGIVREMCDRVAVMYAGRIVEEGPVDALFSLPRHPYTAALLRSIPALDTPRKRLDAIPGQVPSPLHYPAGCRFHDRCPHALPRCRREGPPLYELGAGRRAACFLAGPEQQIRQGESA